MKKKVVIFFIVVCLVLIATIPVLGSEDNNLIEKGEDNIVQNKVADYELDKSSDEKQENIMIEGLEETITTLKYNSSVGYSMRYDKDRFNISKDEGMDVYSQENSEAYLTVEGYDTTYEQVVDNLKSEGKTLEEVNVNGNKAMKYSKTVGETLVTYYYIQAKDGVFIISVYNPNTVEYAEGWNNRIEKMLQSFEIHANGDEKLQFNEYSENITPLDENTTQKGDENVLKETTNTLNNTTIIKYATIIILAIIIILVISFVLYKRHEKI